MHAPERLTLDVTVARDYREPERPRHTRAVALFELARQGVVQLFSAPQGYRLDVGGDLAEKIEAAFGTEEVAQAPQLAYPSEVTYPGENLFPGAVVPGFVEAWEKIASSWHSHEGKPPGVADRFHIETHVLAGHDVFLTDDRSLLVMCRRLRDEHGISIVAMSLGEYVERRLGGTPPPP